MQENHDIKMQGQRGHFKRPGRNANRLISDLSTHLSVFLRNLWHLSGIKEKKLWSADIIYIFKGYGTLRKSYIVMEHGLITFTI